MKRILYAFALMTFLPFMANGQNMEELGLRLSEHFVYFFDGELLREGEYTLKKKKNWTEHYRLEGKYIPKGKIKFYQDEFGYFGNTRHKGAPPVFVMRAEVGAFDIFYSNVYTGSVTAGGDYIGGSSKKAYYAKGFSDIKNLNFDNLARDLSVFPNKDFPEHEKTILNHLSQGKKNESTRMILGLSGLGVIVSSLIVYSITDDSGFGFDSLFETDKTNRQKLILGFTGIGFGISLSAGAVSTPSKHYLKAIRAYNQYY